MRMQIYENSRKNHKYGELLQLPSLNYQRFRTGQSPDSRAMKGLLRINKGKNEQTTKKRGKGGKNPRAEDLKPEEKVEAEKYNFLNKARGFQISELRTEKEDSFLKSTFPQSKIVSYLGLFKGMFTKATLSLYYYEGIFILEQNYSDLKKTLMMNEVISLAIEMVRKSYVPSPDDNPTVMANLMEIMTLGARDVLNG